MEVSSSPQHLSSSFTLTGDPQRLGSKERGPPVFLAQYKVQKVWTWGSGLVGRGFAALSGRKIDPRVSFGMSVLRNWEGCSM